MRTELIGPHAWRQAVADPTIAVWYRAAGNPPMDAINDFLLGNITLDDGRLSNRAGRTIQAPRASLGAMNACSPSKEQMHEKQALLKQQADIAARLETIEATQAAEQPAAAHPTAAAGAKRRMPGEVAGQRPHKFPRDQKKA